MTLHRFLWFTLFILLAGVTAGYDGRAVAQPACGGAREQQQVAEFQRLLQRVEQSPDPEEQLAALAAAIKMEAALKRWPFQYPRERLRGELRNRLGVTYWTRTRADRPENLELAIKAYEAGLSVFTREAFPEDWADTQNNLGAAYRDRIQGDQGRIWSWRSRPWRRP